jgi:hypothetical protein
VQESAKRWPRLGQGLGIFAPPRVQFGKIAFQRVLPLECVKKETRLILQRISGLFALRLDFRLRPTVSQNVGVRRRVGP